MLKLSKIMSINIYRQLPIYKRQTFPQNPTSKYKSSTQHYQQPTFKKKFK